MYKPETVLENETNKIIWNFELQTDHLILARWADLMIVNKKENLMNSGLGCSGWLQNKTERKQKER